MSEYQRNRSASLAYARHLRRLIADGLQVNNARTTLKHIQREMAASRRFRAWARGTP